MAIQVTLSANQFNYSGTYNDHQYTSIQVESVSNGRIYFTTIRNGMRLSRMAKQMKLVDGNVIISFGKNDKLIVGTYTDDTIQEVIEEEVTDQSNVQSLFTNVTPYKHTPNVIDYITHGQYAFQLSEGKDNHSMNPDSKLYSVIAINMLTGEIDNSKCTCYDEGICQVIYLTKEAAIRDINSYSVQESTEPKQSRINLTKKPIPATNKLDQLTESFPKLNMIADYANIQYTGNQALITFTNAKESNTVTFKYRRSWSAKKYIDTAFNKTGIKPSWEFRYGWEYIS